MLDWQKHTKLRIFIRTICIVLIVTFFSYDLTWAGAGEVFSNKNKRASQDSPSVEIPQELGVVKDSYTSKYNPHKLVIHIQDAHANVEAQENEAKIIQYLQDKYNVNLVSVEGGFGDFDAGFFRSFPKDKKVRDKIAKYFLSKAFISGSDYLLITEKNPPAVYGAEDRELYTAHLNTFKDNQTSADSLNQSLKTLESVVSTLKDRYYSKDLKEFDAKISDFKQGRISLEEYLSYLNIAAIINNADLSKFPNLYNLITSQELERKINFEQAESERQDLIESLTKALSKSDLEELVKTSLDFKANKITPAEYYTYLEKLTKDTVIQVSNYNNLFTYIKYITLSQNLDNSKVFDEIDDFTQSLKDKLIVTGVQKDIDNLTYIIRIFKGLADINLSPNEYEHFKNTREEFNQRRLAQLFRRYVDSSYLKSLPSDAEIDSLEKFYSLAHDRDKAIVSNSLNRLNREYSTNAVIIVAGGFHTQGLTSILKEKDISYVVVAPNIKSSQEKENTYFALLKDKKLPLSDILNDPDTLQIINSISDPEARQLLVNYWVARASRYYSPKELQTQLDRLRLSEEDQKAVGLALEEISPKETILVKQEVLPVSHEEQKPSNDGLTAGVEEQKRDNAPQPAAGSQQSFFRRFFMTFVLSFALFIFTGCASTFSARLGPVGIRSHTEVTLTQPKQHEPPVSVAGSIELGDKVNKQVSAQQEKKQKTSQGVELNSQGKVRLGPITGELAPKIGITKVPEGEAPISLSGKVSLGETVKPQGVELATEAKARFGPLNAGINPKVGLSDVPQGEKPLSLDGKVSLDEVRPKTEQKEVFPQPQAAGVQEAAQQQTVTSQPTQAEIQSAEQKALEARVKALEEISAQKEKALQDARAKILQLQQEAKERLERIEMQNKQTQEKLSQVDSELAKANQQNTSAQEKIQKLNQEQDAAGAKIKALDDKRQALESESAALKDRVKTSEDSLSKAESRISSLEEYNKHWWHGLGTGWKIILSILGALGIGTAILRIGLYKSWQRLRQLRTEVSQKEEEKERLDAQIAAQKQTLADINIQVEQAKVAAVESENKRKQEEAELQKAAVELAKFKVESEKLQAELIRITQEKNKALEDLEKKEAELKTAIAEKQAVLNSPQRDSVIKEKTPNVEVKEITDPEIDRGVEFLRQSNTKSAQGLLRSQKIDLRARMRFVHDELGFDIAAGQGRSLLSRNPDTLKEQKVFLQSTGLPLTVSNLSSSKRSFAKKELKQIVKHPEWQELTNEEKLSVVSHLYDIYGLRLSWLLRDNDWYQLLNYFNLPGEPINYTPRSIDFIQRYELSRFQKFANIPQTKYRLSKIKAVIELLDLKVASLLNRVTTKEGFELYVVKPEVTEGKVDYDKQYYPLPKTPFILEDLRAAGEVEEGTVEPDEALVTADLEGRVAALKQEITQKQEELSRLEAERQKKVAEFDAQIRSLTEQRDKLLQQIEELRRSIEAKRGELSLAVAEQEDKVSGLKANISGLEKEQVGLKGTIKDLQRRIEELQALIKSLEERKSKADQELSVLGDVAGARTQVDEANRRLQEAQDNQSQLEQTIAALSTKKQDLETVLSSQEAQKRKLEADISALSGQAQGLEQRIAELNSQKIALAQKEKSLSDEIDAKAQKLRETEEQIVDLGKKNTVSDTQLADLKKQKKTLETEIAKLSQLISELSSDARKAKGQIDTLKVSLAGLEEQRKSTAENLEALGNNRAALNTEITSLEAQRGQLNAELERLRQEFSGIKQDAAVRRGSLDKDITQRQQALNQLNSDISALDTQKKKLDQEIGEAQKKKQQESQDLDRLNREREEINQRIAQARQQLEEVNTQIQGYSGTLEEIKQRGVNLNQEIPALSGRRDALKDELTTLEKSKRELEASIVQAKQDSRAVIPKSPPAVSLPKPYSLMIFDVDNTLTDVTTEINIDLLNQLLDFLSQNVRIALVTAQSMDEVNRYIVGLVKDKKHLLAGLTVYSSGGAKCFSFDAQGQAINGSDYDATIGLTMTIKPKEVEDAIRRVVGGSAGIGFRDGLITITGLSNREKTFGELTTLFKEEGWHFVPRLAGGHTIHVLIGGVDKARAARHFVKELSPRIFGQEIPYGQVLVIGDSFSAGGLDADLIAALPQADIVSVGKKPQGRQLRDLNARGLLFSEDLVGGRNWQATSKILKEVGRGKSVRQIGQNSPRQSGGSVGRGLASFIFALTAGIFSVFPSEISNAQMSLPRGPQQVQVVQVDSRTEAKIKQLIEDLKNEDKRPKAVKELVKIGAPAVRYLVVTLSPVYPSRTADQEKIQKTCQDILDSIGEQAKDALIAVAQDKTVEESVSWEAIRQLSKFHTDDVINALYQILTIDKRAYQTHSSCDYLRDQAAGSLAKIGMLAADSLYKAITNEDEKVRSAAGEALSKIGEEALVPVTSVFTQENYQKNISAIDKAIKLINDGRINHAKTREALKWVIITAELPENKFYPDTTQNAATALINLGHDGAVTLGEMLRDKTLIQKSGTFEKVLEAIVKAKPNYYGSSEIYDSLEWLVTDASTGEKTYSPYAVKLAVRTLTQLGKEGNERLLKSFSPENYLKSRIRSEALDAIAELKIKDPEVIKKLYWLAIEAVIDGGRYYTNISNAAGSALYQLEGDKAIKTLVAALKDSDWRKRDGAAEAILGIARSQGKNLNSEVIVALQEIRNLGTSHDYRQEVIKETESLLKQLTPDKVVFFSPERYRNYPQKMILDVNMFVAYQNTNFVDEMAKAVIYAEGDSSFNRDILKACVESLLKLGEKGQEALAGVINHNTYQQCPNNLKAVAEILAESKPNSSKLSAALISLAQQPDLVGGKYYPDLNKQAVQALINMGSAGNLVDILFFPDNYRSKPAQLQLIVDSIAETKTQGPKVSEKLSWAFNYRNDDGSWNNALRVSLINAFVKLDMRSMTDSLVSALSDTNEETRKAAVQALIAFKVPQAQIENLINADNPLTKEAAREILKTIAPGRLEELTQPKAAVVTPAVIQVPDNKQPGLSGKLRQAGQTLAMGVSVADLRGKLFFQENYHQAAQALRDYYQEKPWTEKIPNYLLSYISDAQIWILIGLGLAGLITGIVFYVRGQKVRAVYKQLASYVGQTTWSERRRLKKAAVQVAKKTHYDVDDVYKAIAEKLPEVAEITQNKRIEKIAKFLDKLNQAKVNSGQVLRYGVPFMAQAAKDEKEFDKGLDILADTAREMQKNNISVDTIFGYSLSSISSYVTEFSVFEAACKLIKELSSRKQNPQEILTSVAPQALKTAKDANNKVARLNIILHLLLESIHPTQLLIETLEKTTSQSNLTSQLTQWSRLMNDFKTGAVKFDINNPVYVDLEYTTYRQLASQLSQSNTYENYQSLIQQFRSQSGAPSGLAAQEQAEVKLAVYEAYRLLEFIVAVKNKADKIARPVWVIPNLSYGKFAVSPILDELGKLNIEVHYAKVGSTGAHEHPEYIVKNLFTDDVYLRILRERPILVVVDGTQHLMPRPEEGKSSRYPDAYVGYRNMAVALNEVISERKEDKFLDKVHITKDFFGTLHQNSEYTSLVDTLEKLNAGLDQPMLFYKLGFWNPAGLPLVVREARKEVQKVTPLNPDDLDSPTLIFINSPLLDDDLPADIKQWAGLEQPHVPAYFDDKGQIQQTMFAVNGRGVYLSHSMEFETNRACQEIKDNYKGRLPQIVYQQPTPESVRSSYEAMLFDLDGTLTDTLSEIDKSLLNKLIYFLSSGVVIGIVTSQRLEEVKKYILDKVDSNNSAALQSLVIFTARGAQAWGFDQNKNPYVIYDRSQTDLNDQQRQLIRQLVNQALGSLVGDSDVTDRYGQITIRLKKNKDKRDLVNTTLNQLIANNNLPFQTEYSGNSTIHVVMRGIDKGTAKDYFISQLLPQRLNHQTDVSKLLIAGDRFQEGGSDRPMVVPGARVVSVGGKDKSVPAGVEVYPHHGWKGTNQLLGDIINKSGRTTVTLPSVIIGLFGLPDFWQRLNDAGQGLYDASKKPLLYFGIATLGLGFLFLSITSGIKYYKAYRIYKEIKQALSFLDGKDSRRLFKAVSGYTTWKKIQHIDAYDLLVDILPVLSKQTQDKRLIETANTAARLKKSKINPRHVFKYVLTPISSKTSDEKQFIKSLGIAERFALSFNDKRFDYHDLLRDTMPSLAATTRSIDELNEAMLLGITLVNSGRNPTFALTRMLPEVAALTKSFSDFRLGIYALQQLCLEGFEPTKYLIHELIKQGNPQKIDQTISDWQEIRRKFKTGEVAFNPKNQLHANLEYTTFRELVDRTLKQTRKYSFAEYQQILGNFNNNHNQPHLRRTEKAEIKFAAYEAFRFRQFVLDVKKQADKMGKKVWVVPNLSYGRFAVSPIIKDLAADGIEVHYARIGSTESHDNALLIKPELFSAALYARIMNEQPIIIVVDGTQHLLARPKDRKSGRYPDAYVGYRNLIITVNDILTQAQEQFFKHLVKTDGSLIRHLRKKSDYRTLRRRLIRLYNSGIKTKRSLYALEFWNPGGLELALRRDRKEVTRARNVSPISINQPTLIFVNSVMLDEDVPVFIRDWINRDKKIHHKPAYFDDTSHIQNIIFNVDSSGVSLSDEIYANIRREYKRIKGIYRPSFNLPAKSLNLPKLPYKAVISDLDGTLSDTLEEVPKPVMEKLLYLLSLGVQVAIVTTQSYKEVEKYLLSQVPAKNKALLQNLTIYAATGSQGFGFDKNGDPLNEPIYDTSDVKLSDRQMDAWRGIIKAMLEEYALDKEVKDKKGNVIATPVKIIDAGSQVIIRLKERGFLRREIVKRLQLSLNREQLPITLKEIGGTSIRMTIKGIDKSIAVDYHLTQVCKARFGFEPKPNEVLILGNSFDEDGDDRDMMVRGARVFSVGHRPLLHHLRIGINFYPEHSWEGSDQVLAEFINAMSNKVEEAKKQTPQPASTTLNSFAFLPFLAAGGFFDNLDSFTSFVLGCIAGIAATLLIFKDRIFGTKENAEPQDYYDKQEPQQDTPAFDRRKPIIEKTRTRGFDTYWQLPPLPRKRTDFNQAAAQIREEYPGVRVGIIGAADPTKGYLPQTGVELGRKLRAYLGDKGFVFTGGVSGVGVDVYQGVMEASGGQDDRFFVLLPEGMYAGREYREISPTKKVNTANFGEDMFERRIGMGKVADAVVILNGRNGTLHEAVSALESGRKVIALNYGGAGALLYHAKVNGIVPVLLAREGVKQEHLNNIIACDISGIEQALDSITGVVPSEKVKAAEETAKPEETKNLPQQEELPLFEQSNAVVDNPVQLDYFGKYVFTANKDGSMSLSREAVSAINSLSQAYNGMILEIDADTLIDTSKGTPQLKGIGFKEAAASLYQAQEKKEIPDNIHIRLININPELNRKEIIKVLGLTDDLLKSFVVIPNIPQDYIIKTLEPYLIAGSIRIIFEDNVRYWGKKVDVLVKRGEETKTLSSLGLIVAGLAKEPKFYEQLPKELKEYIVAKTDETGKVQLDDEGKIKQLIFKPIEKSKVDTQYLDKLDKANKELEGMV